MIAADRNSVAPGVAPGAEILFLKVFQGGVAYTSDIIEAIAYAEAHGAKIVNCSWGTTAENPALAEAILNSEMLFISAAGNRLQNNDNEPIYPASYGFTNTIAVASVNSNGKLSRFSNYGPTTVDVAAPGSDINVLTLDNSYTKNSGTSLAAAAVSGQAALIMSIDNQLSAGEVKNIIIQSSSRVTGLNDKVNGGRLIDVYHAVSSPGHVNPTVLP